MAKQIQGWLPYGSDDESVILALPLTREIVAADVTGKYTTVSKQGTGLTPTHDSVLGVKGKDVNGAEAGYRLSTPVGSFAALMDNGGQVTFEAESAGLCYNDPTNGSSGGPSAHHYWMRATPGTGPNFTVVKFNANNVFRAELAGGNTNEMLADDVAIGASQTGGFIHSEGKGQFCKINIAWYGGRNGGDVIVAVDDLIIGGDKTTSTTLANMLNQLDIGHAGAVAGGYTREFWMRNLQFSKRPPVLPVHPLLSHVLFLSDSLTTATTSLGQAYRDVYANYTMRRTLNKHGMRPGKVTVDQNTVYGIGTFTATQLETRVATILAQQPTLVITMGGVVDAAEPDYNSANFLAEYKDLIEQIFFGTAKTSRTSVQKICICTPTPRTDALTNATYASQHADIRAHIASLPAWWDSNYGSQWGQGRVFVSDVFSAFSEGHSWAATAGNTTDGLLLAWRGNRLYGETVGNSILRNLE